MQMLGLGGGLAYDDEEHNYRDVYWGGSCDDGCHKLADLLGWGVSTAYFFNGSDVCHIASKLVI